MTLLAPNRRVLAARFPEVLAALEHAPITGGPPPGEIAPSLLEDIGRSQRLFLVIPGLPAAAALTAVLARAPRACVLWFLESDAAPLAARLASENLAVALTDPRVFVSVGPPGASELLRLNREFAWVDNARALFQTTRYAQAPQLWQPLLIATLTRLQQRWQQVFTDLKLSPVRFENTCRNLNFFLAESSIESLAGAFAGTPLVLVAAGPSLDDALPFIAQIHRHALVVTGNTSFRALAARGLPPHLTVSVDPYHYTELGYRDQPTARTHLVAPVFAFPGIWPRFAGRGFGLGDQSPLLARLRRAAGLPAAPALIDEGTVSATVLNLAAYLGCSAVYFVGQDLAIADDGRTHASDTFYTDLKCNQQDDEQVHRVPGTTRPAVTVPSRHLWYLRIIEGVIARMPRVRCFNTSPLGAAIAGAPYLPYAEAGRQIAAAPARDFFAELAARHPTASGGLPAAALGELARARAATGEAFRLAVTAAIAGQLAADDPSPENRRVFAEAGQRFEDWRRAHPEEQALFFDGCTKQEIFAAERRRLQFAAGDPLRAVRDAEETAWAFAEGTAFLHQHLAATG